MTSCVSAETPPRAGSARANYLRYCSSLTFSSQSTTRERCPEGRGRVGSRDRIFRAEPGGDLGQPLGLGQDELREQGREFARAGRFASLPIGIIERMTTKLDHDRGGLYQLSQASAQDGP